MSFEFGNPAYSQSAKGDHRVVVGVAGGNGYQQVPNTPQKTLSAQLADYTNRFKLEEDSVIVLRNVHKTYLLGIGEWFPLWSVSGKGYCCVCP